MKLDYKHFEELLQALHSTYGNPLSRDVRSVIAEIQQAVVQGGEIENIFIEISLKEHYGITELLILRSDEQIYKNIFKFLLNYGLNPYKNIKSNSLFQSDSLSFACSHSKTKVVELILEYESKQPIGKSAFSTKCPPILSACAGRGCNTVQFLISKDPSSINTCFTNTDKKYPQNLSPILCTLFGISDKDYKLGNIDALLLLLSKGAVIKIDHLQCMADYVIQKLCNVIQSDLTSGDKKERLQGMSNLLLMYFILVQEFERKSVELKGPFLQGHHPRLGEFSPVNIVGQDILRYICETLKLPSKQTQQSQLEKAKTISDLLFKGLDQYLLALREQELLVSNFGRVSYIFKKSCNQIINMQDGKFKIDDYSKMSIQVDLVGSHFKEFLEKSKSSFTFFPCEEDIYKYISSFNTRLECLMRETVELRQEVLLMGKSLEGNTLCF